MAHKKSGGSSRNGRDSPGQRLGVKKFGGERVRAGNAGPVPAELGGVRGEVREQDAEAPHFGLKALLTDAERAMVVPARDAVRGAIGIGRSVRRRARRELDDDRFSFVVGHHGNPSGKQTAQTTRRRPGNRPRGRLLLLRERVAHPFASRPHAVRWIPCETRSTSVGVRGVPAA